MYKIPLLGDDQNVSNLLDLLATETPHYWQERGDRSALQLFHAMATRVPAYKDFLHQHGVKNHDQIRTIEDFQSLPLINKGNYLESYPLEDLCWDGNFTQGQWVISSTSGSSGKPFYCAALKPRALHGNGRAVITT